MYLEHWGLTEKPFENTPDPRFLYHSPQHDEAYVRMLYVIRERKGAGMLTGIFGCGKTLIGQALMEELALEKYQTVYVANPRLSDIDFLRIVAHRLGVNPLPTLKSDLLIQIETALTNNQRNGKDTIILIDEAHAIDDGAIFEEIRLLLNFQLKDRFLLTLLLLGQPELIPKVNALKQLEQRISMKCHLRELSKDETHAYILHRLSVAGLPAEALAKAGAARPLFSEEALNEIHEHTGGIPRRINRLCDICLLAGFVNKAPQITPTLVMEEVRSLGGEA